MARPNPAQLIRQVRQEVEKVTWPQRRELVVTTSMVFVVSVIVALFFLLVDQILAFGVKTIFGFGG